MKTHLLAVCLVALATSGCGKMASFVGLERGETTTPAKTPAAMTLSEPVRTVQPAPRPVTDGSWQRNVAQDIPYFNMSSTPVTVYKETDRTTKIGSLAPGEGGYIETCSDAEPICKITLADASNGWVMMDRMGGITN